MSMSTFQKVTLATCLVLCVALLLPKMLLSRGKKDAAHTEGSPGRFPPMVHRQMAPDSQGQSTLGSQFSRSHNTEAVARAKGGGTGAGTGGKSNLAGQIIPIYGFGILMYILYILFKITSKGNTKPKETKFPSVRSENLKRKITDFELTQLQEKLKETEMVMEKIVSKASHSPERVRGVSADQEETLLLQLREITRVMQERHLVEGVAPEKKAEDWEGFPEDPHQCWEMPFCGYNTQQYSPEEEAERTEPGGVDQEDGVTNQDEGGTYQDEAAPDQEECGACQEEVVAHAEGGVSHQEGGVDLEQGYVVDDMGGACKTGVLSDRGKNEDIAGDECWAQEYASVMDEDNVNEEKVGGGEDQIGVATDGIRLDREELTLEMSTMQEPDEKNTVHLPNYTSTSITRIRRRHKKKTQSSAFED
ncbi:protein RIC-3b [Osmerus mordax]|uniref:protein RIC-3b n=2 Tax=Osmerus TaxID=8013 RepID=UPI00350F2C85